MTRCLIVLGLLCWAFITPSSAADLWGPKKISTKDGTVARDEAAYGSKSAWTGAYVGGHLGYGWADTEATTTLEDADSRVTFPFDHDSDGIVGGFHAGYNWNRRGIVYGIEADIDFGDLDSSQDLVDGIRHQTEIKWLGSVRGRVGYALDKTLVYMTAGWAFGEVEAAVTSNLDNETLSYDDVRHGWTIGGGVERVLWGNITARLEYRYTDLGNDKATFSNGDGVDVSDSSDVTVQTVRAGVSWRF